MTEPFFRRIYKHPPILFPLAALFLIVMTFIAVITLYPTPLLQIDWLRPLAMLLFSICWLFVCDMRKWAAIVFISMTMICLALQYFAPLDSAGKILSSGLFPLDMVLSFFVLLYFKRFR